MTKAHSQGTPQDVMVEIFRSGTHTAADGSSVSVKADDLSAVAGAYDPRRHEAPIVFGHPTDDAAPAHGWVAGLVRKGDRLVATLKDVSPALKDLVAQGAYRKVSAAFYRADAPGNPTPGYLHLHHVGVLGAVPPAVKGLQPIQFKANDDALMTFAADVQVDEQENLWGRLWLTLRALLNRPSVQSQLLGVLTSEKALNAGFDLAREVMQPAQAHDLRREKTTDGDDPEAIENKTGSDTPESVSDSPSPKLAAPRDALGAVAEGLVNAVRDSAAQTPEPAIELGVAAVPEDSEAGLLGRLSFAEHEARLRTEIENEHLLDQLVAEGRLPGGQRDDTLAFMGSLSREAGVVAFSEGGGASPLSFFCNLLRGLPPLVAFAEVAAPSTEGPAPVDSLPLPKGAYVDPHGLSLHEKAEAIRRADPNTSYLAAVAQAAQAN